MSEDDGISAGAFTARAEEVRVSDSCRPQTPAQTCQVDSDWGAPAQKAPTEAAVIKALSARFMALAGQSRATIPPPPTPS